ncbi:MAG: hypothetical protein K8H85_13105 [Cyclobacteriaceae bacterium]|nr:hypothetical protein [Cyclobacteriaceae bacterium]
MAAIESDVLDRITEIEKDSKVNLKVPVKLTDPHNLVIAAKNALSLRNEHTAHSLRNEGVLANAGPLSIRVSPKNVGRALRLFDAVIKVFLARGHQFTGSSVDLGGQKYEVSIREKLKKVEGSSFEKAPTDVLCLKIYGGYPLFEMYDSKSVLIEGKIARIIAKVELDVEYFKKIWARNAKQKEEEMAIEKMRLEYLAQQENELKNFKLLLNLAHRLSEAKLIRDYVQLTEDKAKQAGSISADLENWILWAREKADWYDPHIEKEVELLKDVDKVTLAFGVMNE